MNDLIELASAVSPFTIVGEGNVSEEDQGRICYKGKRCRSKNYD